jgi:hypothetical protein
MILTRKRERKSCCPSCCSFFFPHSPNQLAPSSNLEINRLILLRKFVLFGHLTDSQNWLQLFLHTKHTVNFRRQLIIIRYRQPVGGGGTKSRLLWFVSFLNSCSHTFEKMRVDTNGESESPWWWSSLIVHLIFHPLRSLRVNFICFGPT